MTALAITTSQVVRVSGDTDKVMVGEPITLGQLCYLNDTDSRWYRAKANGTAAEAGASGLGLAFSTAIAAGNEISMIKPGAIVTLGAAAAPAAGVVYYVSPTVGGISPVADIVSTNKVTVAAIGIGSNQVMLTRVYNGGAVL